MIPILLIWRWDMTETQGWRQDREPEYREKPSTWPNRASIPVPIVVFCNYDTEIWSLVVGIHLNEKYLNYRESHETLALAHVNRKRKQNKSEQLLVGISE